MLTDLETLVIGQTVKIPVEFVDDNETPIPLFGSVYHFNLKDTPRVPDNEAALSVTVTFPENQESNCGKGFLEIGSDDWGSVLVKQYYWSAYRTVSGTPNEVYPDGAGKVNVIKALNSSF